MLDSSFPLLPISALPGHARLATSPLVVLALCADWCGTCREFRPLMQRLAQARPDIVFAWADVEDDAEQLGDIDVETFPTLAFLRDGVVLHFGASLPQADLVGRMIDTLAGRAPQAATNLPEAVIALAHHIGGKSAR